MKLTRRKVIGGLAALFAAGGAVGFLKRMSSGVYSGPVSDHFDGTHFVGPYATKSNGTLAFWKWRFTRQPAVWPAWIDNKQTDQPPAGVDNGLRVSFVGHATYPHPGRRAEHSGRSGLGGSRLAVQLRRRRQARSSARHRL